VRPPGQTLNVQWPSGRISLVSPFFPRYFASYSFRSRVARIGWVKMLREEMASMPANETNALP